MKPIYEQIDPARLAEVERLLRIATEYGERLDCGNAGVGSSSGNLKPGALAKLLAKYPSHGFVIDKQEARTLFHHIDDADDLCARLADELAPIINFALDREPFTFYLGSPPSVGEQGSKNVPGSTEQASENSGGNSEGA